MSHHDEYHDWQGVGRLLCFLVENEHGTSCKWHTHPGGLLVPLLSLPLLLQAFTEEIGWGNPPNQMP